MLISKKINTKYNNIQGTDKSSNTFEILDKRKYLWKESTWEESGKIDKETNQRVEKVR